MTKPPARPKIYHITHVDNLTGIVRDGAIWSDAKRIELGLDSAVVGIEGIKSRRLGKLNVRCHPGTKVGQYVPFYFCPRSIMLYIFHMGNRPELTYKGGQGPILHLQADLMATIRWAEDNHIRWAFSDRNAGGYLAQFFRSVDDLSKINWDAVQATDFHDPVIKEGKQAEFLVYESFPWNLVEKIGACDTVMAAKAALAIGDSDHKPLVAVEREWYY